MRRCSPWLAGCVTILLCSPADAARDDRQYSLCGGVTLPVAALADSTGAGWMAGFASELWYRDSFALGGNLSFQRPGRSENEGFRFSTLLLTINGRYVFANVGNARFSVVGGPGLYLLIAQAVVEGVAQNLAGTSTGDTGLRFGLFGGVGASIARSEATDLTLEADFHHIFHGREPIESFPPGRAIEFVNVAARFSLVFR